MMKLSSIVTIGAIGLSISSVAGAQTAGNLLGAPVTAVGGVVSNLGTVHARIAPLVTTVVPSANPVADGVTSGIRAVGAGVTGTGNSIQANGLLVGSSAGRPLVSVGAPPAHQGSVAAVLNPR
jgi:hypothetical protein